MSRSTEWKGETYEAFRERVFGDAYAVWHDGPHLSGPLPSSGEEGDHNRAMLTQGAQQEDYAAIVGWEAFDAQQGVAVLKPLVATARKPEFIGRLVAFLQTHDTDATKQDIADREQLLTSVVEGAGSFASLDALMTASKIPSKAVLEALLKKVEDDAYLTRYHAANSILKLLKGDAADIYAHKTLFRGIVSRVDDRNKELPLSAEDRERFAVSARKLRRMINLRWPLLKLKRLVTKS